MSPRWSIVGAFSLLLACQRREYHEQVPPLGMFCVQPANWDHFLQAMREFGAKHGLELHGGVETHPDGKRLFNAYLARGYSYWWGDDLDLWVTSNPYVERRMTLNGISRKPWTFSDYLLANELLAKTVSLRCFEPGNGWLPRNSERPLPTRLPR